MSSDSDGFDKFWGALVEIAMYVLLFYAIYALLVLILFCLFKVFEGIGWLWSKLVPTIIGRYAVLIIGMVYSIGIVVAAHIQGFGWLAFWFIGLPTALCVIWYVLYERAQQYKNHDDSGLEC